MKAAVVALLTAGLAAGLHAEDRMVRWDEMPRTLVEGRKVEVRLEQGTMLYGKALEVTPDGVRMAIDKVRDGTGRFAKGEFLVPAAEITRLRIDQTGTRGRVIGTAIGGGLAAAIGLSLLAIASSESMSPGPAAGIAIAPAGIGYGLGWLRDHHVVTVYPVR